VQFVPSLIYSPSSLVTNAMWARPYVGGGLNIYRSTLRSTTGSSLAVDNGLGSQAFGGAEFTLSALPQLVVSADVRKQWVPTSFDGFEMGGLGFTMSAHWYVK
jgi:outer membrane protein W